MMTSAALTPSSSWMPVGMPRPLSRTVQEPSGLSCDVDAVGMARQGLVDGIVHDFIDHVMQARAVIGVADIHAGALAHGIQALQHLDAAGAIFVGHLMCGFRHLLHHDRDAGAGHDSAGAFVDAAARLYARHQILQPRRQRRHIPS